MLRGLWILFSACCAAVVLSEALGLGVLWSKGHLTTRQLREIRDVFGPQEKEAVAATGDAQPPPPSSQDVLRERSLRVLSLSARETEVGLLKTMLETERNGLIAQLADFEKQKKSFQTQLMQLSDKNVLAAREQTRGVLLALAPADAADRLMQLTAEEDVMLLREMEDAKIALLLKELAAPGEGEASATAKDVQSRTQRARDIFERIAKGEPRQSIIRSALDSQLKPEAERANPANSRQ